MRSATRPEQPARFLTAGLVAACLGYFMVILDTTIVNVALPAVQADLHTDLAGLQWVVDAYLVVLAAGILTGGALSDRCSARTVFCWGVSLFTAASVACGMAPTSAWLIASRAAQGAASAMLVPSSLALVRAEYSDIGLRRRAIGMWATIAGIAAAGGPVVGGLGVDLWSWRWVFFVNVPFGLLCLALTSRHVPRSNGIPRALDLRGQVLAVLALGALAVTLIEGAHTGATPFVGAAGCVCLAAGAAFVFTERRVPEPMLPLGLFRDSTFAGGAAIGLLINFGFYGGLFVINLYFQQLRGASPLQAGLAVLPQLGSIMAGSSVSARISARAGGPRFSILLSLSCLGIGFSGVLLAGAHTPYVALIVPLALTGFGMGVVMPAVTAALTDAAPLHHAGLASGVINSARQSGSVIGVALLGGLVARLDNFVLAVRLAIGVAAMGFFLGVLIAALTVRQVRTARTTTVLSRPPVTAGSTGGRLPVDRALRGAQLGTTTAPALADDLRGD
ncbi:MAG TPA: MFS transporter [Sporichthyaceae bacterium]|nr:MFS transporter [Sporichthyaceae bacterium]